MPNSERHTTEALAAAGPEATGAPAEHPPHPAVEQRGTLRRGSEEAPAGPAQWRAAESDLRAAEHNQRYAG